MFARRDKLSAFHEVFTDEVLRKIGDMAVADDGLKVLSQMLIGANEYLRIDRFHLDRLLQFAINHGGLDNDRHARLTRPGSYHSWKAVYNELLVAYFFAKKFKLNVELISTPDQKGYGDFHLLHPDGPIMVEVKTPRGDDPNLQGPQKGAHWGWDEDLLKGAFLDGASQLQRGNKNLIVICTQLCAWIRDYKPLQRLLYGHDVLTAALDAKAGRIVGPVKSKFVASGELHRHEPSRFTRISAIASFKEDIIGMATFAKHIKPVQFTVLHNYHAICPISDKVFSSAEQFVPKREHKEFDHVKQNHSDIQFFLGNTGFSDFILKVYNFLYKCFRKARRFYWRLRMRGIRKRLNKT